MVKIENKLPRHASTGLIDNILNRLKTKAKKKLELKNIIKTDIARRTKLSEPIT